MSDVQRESNLNHAERMARVEAAIAKKHLGRIPMAAKLYYQQGRYYQHKQSFLILALGAFWRATMESRLAVALGAKRGD